MIIHKNKLVNLELCNLYGINVFRHTKDKSAKNRYRLLVGIWVFLLCMLFFYVGGMSFGLIKLGMADIVPAYLITIASLLLFVFGIFKAGSMIFSSKGYDSLSALPITQLQIVSSRFIRMYVEDLILTLVILLPGIAVYGFMIKPGLMMYVLSLVSILVIPLLPLIASTIVGTLITGISARMRHKTMTQTLLTLIFVVVIMLGSFGSSKLEGELTPEAIKNLAGMVHEMIGNIYPPAIWMAEAMLGDTLLGLALYYVLTFALLSAMLYVITKYFHSICSRLYETSAKHNYKMQTLKGKSVILTLYAKELRRYFASSIYVTNTIVGPIMATLMSVSILVVGMEKVQDSIGLPFDLKSFLPFVVAAIFGMMTTTSTSISMEGKQFWIIKSLPVSTKMILDSKILMNLSLIAPFYLVSEVLLIIATKPGLMDLIWLICIPLCLIFFSCVVGITVNLIFYNLNWEREEYIIKQSASSMLGGFAGMLVSLLSVVPFLILPQEYATIGKTVVCVLIFIITIILYSKNNKKQLQYYN